MRRRTKALLGSFTVAVGLAGWVRFGSLPTEILLPRSVSVPTFLARDGTPLDAAASRARNAARGLLSFGPTTSRSTSTDTETGPSLAQQADRLAAATKAAEDRRFSAHIGIDPLAITRAIVADARARHVVQGGSTITQQLVKLRSSSSANGRTFVSKIRQAVYAVRLEHRVSKDDILSAYLAEAPYGGRLIGAEAAAQGYFSTSASQLSWAQAAYLAALPQRPTAFNPRRNADAAVNRQRWILRRLRTSGQLTDAELKSALTERLGLATDVFDPLAPHFTEMLGKREKDTGELREKGAPLRTTLDAMLQKEVVGIARQQRRSLQKNHAANVAVVVLDNATGAVRAWEGSGDYFDANHGGMLNGPLLARQTGSTMKPFIYASAFDAGAAPGDLIDDTPFETLADGKSFRPQNYDHQFRGPITLRQALANSVNVPAVRLLADQSPRVLVDTLKRGGIDLPYGPQHYGLALGLGTAEISLLDLTSAYASFARGGRSLDATFFEPAAVQPGGRRVMSKASAFLISDVLADNDARTPAFGRNSALRFSFPVAAKTGTSQNFHDNWVIGYTADITVGVWVGNFDRTPLAGATGVTGAGPIFHAVMLAAHSRLSSLSDSIAGATLFASVPKELVSKTNGMHTEYRWVGNRTTSSASASPSSSPSSGGRLRMIEPVNGGEYLIDETRPRSTQRLPLRASGGHGSYGFVVDDIPETSGAWLLQAGKHMACVRDSAGGNVCHSFTVS